MSGRPGSDTRVSTRAVTRDPACPQGPAHEAVIDDGEPSRPKAAEWIFATASARASDGFASRAAIREAEIAAEVVAYQAGCIWERVSMRELTGTSRTIEAKTDATTAVPDAGGAAERAGAGTGDVLGDRPAD